MTQQKAPWKQNFIFFEDGGYDEQIELRVSEIASQYLQDNLPWVVGYSGGKDSTATLQLVWMALKTVPLEKRTKPVHVISTDTLVENPIVASWVALSLEKMNTVAQQEGLPVQSHRLTPSLSDSFWVNMIGKGYPAPRQKFRWCTERLKINPSNRFISDVVNKYGETLLILGTRKAESATRAKTMAKHEDKDMPARINPNSSLPNSFVFTPVEDWSNDDVWFFLIETPNPWGHDNAELFTLYQGATEGGECPLVVETGTPSCGDSRFGCWVCTLVEKDKSMQAMIQNDEDKKWLMPLLEIRNELDFRSMSIENGDRHLRDYRRMNGSIQMYNGRHIPGPYKKEFRHHLLKRLLEVEKTVRETGPEYVKNLQLIQPSELEEIRRIWVIDKHEIEDALPGLYEEAVGKPYEGQDIIEDLPFSPDDLKLLEDLCAEDKIMYELLREALSIENRGKVAFKRKGIYQSLEKVVAKNLHHTEEEAVDAARARSEALSQVNLENAE